MSNAVTGLGGKPAQVVISPELLAQIQEKLAAAIDKAAPVAIEVMKGSADLSVEASVGCLRARSVVPAGGSSIDIAAAVTKQALRKTVDSSAEAALPVVKQAAHQSVESTVNSVNSVGSHNS